jgi:hypothetical protein
MHAAREIRSTPGQHTDSLPHLMNDESLLLALYPRGRHRSHQDVRTGGICVSHRRLSEPQTRRVAPEEVSRDYAKGTNMRTAVILWDVFDPCGFTLFTDQHGVIYEAHPTGAAATPQPVPRGKPTRAGK